MIFNSSNNNNEDDVIHNTHVEWTEMCVKHLKSGKVAGAYCLVVHAPPSFIIHLKLSFSLSLSHTYIPDAFSFRIIILLVKDKSGDPSLHNNYRPITLSPVISKLFENVLMELFSGHLFLEDPQFGFRKRVGCTVLVLSSGSLGNFFNNRSSNVYMVTIDASKEFDRVSHYRLCSSLINKPPNCLH